MTSLQPSTNNLFGRIEYVRMSKLNTQYELGFACFQIDGYIEYLSEWDKSLTKVEAYDIVEAWVLENL